MARKKPFSDSSLFDASDVGVSAKLADKFIVPPFTILDGRQSYWMERKRTWLALGMRPEQGKEHLGSTVVKTEWMQRSDATGGSAFDPMLAEIAYRWFTPKGGTILDPFAGSIVRGAVAGVLGHPYVGIEVRKEQVDANYAQWDGIVSRLGTAWEPMEPGWVCGDSGELEETLWEVFGGDRQFDTVFSCPPYYDLEVYSDLAGDGSAIKNYPEFMEWYTDVFRQAVSRLKDNRFLVVVVGDVRDKTGAYYNFVGDNISCMLGLGLKLYNSAIFVTPVGSLPVRTSRQFKSGRKLGQGHQHMLVFYKGDIKKIWDLFPEDVQNGGD